MSYRQRSIGKIGDFLPTVSQENLEEDLLHIRQAAKEYYAHKSGSWKPKRDLDAERLEDELRFHRESFMIPWMGRYSSGPEKMVVVRPRIDMIKIERLREAFEHFDMSALEERIRDTLAKKIDLVRREYPVGEIILDELPTSSPIPSSMKDLKEYQHKFLCGEWESWPGPTAKIGAGKNPMVEHTIRAVKKSHAKRRFSKKSQRGIL